eukprot:CAMPEP_0119402514 /NCGR_PEP_ID=MMETSP1334-20130426/142918_2 /TAXON_ID=127549 /ORGANISM="Calcidiscus leptoporus, Strain RCC1130" /LENGTH=41 /DNA_ID= /DNA_START= /DNA_END= /DNA_ORIENTATION=
MPCCAQPVRVAAGERKQVQGDATGAECAEGRHEEHRLIIWV